MEGQAPNQPTAIDLLHDEQVLALYPDSLKFNLINSQFLNNVINLPVVLVEDVSFGLPNRDTLERLSLPMPMPTAIKTETVTAQWYGRRVEQGK